MHLSYAGSFAILQGDPLLPKICFNNTAIVGRISNDPFQHARVLLFGCTLPFFVQPDGTNRLSG
jgi:hypothetical protein